MKGFQKPAVAEFGIRMFYSALPTFTLENTQSQSWNICAVYARTVPLLQVRHLGFGVDWLYA